MKHTSTFSRMTVMVMVVTSAAIAAGEARITLRGNVEINKNLVRLGDIAEVACDDAEQARDLASLPLMPAPAPGSQRFVQSREIKDALAAHGFALQSLEIGGASQVMILQARAAASREDASGSSAEKKLERRAALLAGQAESSSVRRSEAKFDSAGAAMLNDGVVTLISNYLKTKSPGAGGWTVTCELPPRHLASLVDATSRPVCRGGAAPWTGRQRFEISFATATGATKISVYADVTPPATPVVVTTRAIARGEVVTAADVRLQDIGYVPKAGDRRVVARSVDMLIGMEVRQPMPAGTVVYTDAVQPPVMVKRGDLIRISSQSGGIRVRTTGKALQDRSHGQLVEVESLSTKERFDARVVGPGEAVIVALTPPAKSERTTPIETARLK